MNIKRKGQGASVPRDAAASLRDLRYVPETRPSRDRLSTPLSLLLKPAPVEPRCMVRTADRRLKEALSALQRGDVRAARQLMAGAVLLLDDAIDATAVIGNA